MSKLRVVGLFYVASFVGIVATAALLAVFYRQVAIDSLVQIRKHDNVRLAQVALSSMLHPLCVYLDSAKHIKPSQLPSERFPLTLQKSVQQIMAGPGVVRVKVFNRDGIVVYSTLPEQIGADQSRDDGFVSAIHGTVRTDLIYRDSFNPWGKETEEDNLVETYLPVRRNVASPADGVFEIYTDMNPLAHAIERTTFRLMGGGLALLLLLYAALVLMVHYGRRLIEAQQQTIRERTATLELLTSQILSNQESEKRKLAKDLHEGVAQTLAAIKLSVEGTLRSASDTTHPPEHLHAAVHAIQVAIQEVRAIAMDLHPPVLDDFGLYAALEWLCGEFEALRPGVSTERQLVIDESDVPPALVIIIYRIAADALKWLAQNRYIAKVSLRLARAADTIVFSIEESMTGGVRDERRSRDERDMEMSTMKQRTLLSGGVFTVVGNDTGGRTLRATWVV